MLNTQALQVETDDRVSAELAAGIISMTSPSKTHPKIKPGEALHALQTLNAELAAIKKRGAPHLREIQALAERTWRSNLAYDRRMAQLEREKKQLEHLTEEIWRKFDELIMPLWKFEDSMVPIYEELSTIHIGLDKLLRTPSAADDMERSVHLRAFQERLHEVENKMVDGKFVPGGWNEFGGKIPSGQAMCVNLMQRCYKLVQKISESESIVDPSLITINNKLEDIISNLSSIRDSAQAGFPIDTIELHTYQQQLQAIDSMRRDGKFLNDKGEVPEGQAALHDLLEWAFDLVHECIVEQEAQMGEDSALEGLTEKIGEVRSGLIGYASSASRGVQSVSSPAFSLMYNTLGEGLSYVKDTITHPVSSASSAVTKLRSIVSSSLSYASKISEQLEPIDETLAPLHARLYVIRRTLKEMRNERNEQYLSSLNKAETPSASVAAKERANLELSQFNQYYNEQLTEIMAQLRSIDDARVDGKFLNDFGETPSGQIPLDALLQECFCLAVEMSEEAATDAAAEAAAESSPAKAEKTA
ncbi:hypothetical protein HK105_203085 [Polyrhizophydium stewartii]|uniref:Uncharacterized protein n=1 Tax=Polyrhizophydium stewartii TaxID=2732419 RepID=A0ABR4ND18_9FUNG|nr:hypothetical protein HK105_007869 [Polyrhizophydium stewartii]